MDATPEISFEKSAREFDKSAPWTAHIVNETSHHHGRGASQAEALFNAAFHWLARENSVAYAANRGAINAKELS